MDQISKKHLTLTLVILLLYCIQYYVLSPIYPIYKQPYQCLPKIKYLNLIKYPTRFKNMTNFTKIILII